MATYSEWHVFPFFGPNW